MAIDQLGTQCLEKSIHCEDAQRSRMIQRICRGIPVAKLAPPRLARECFSLNPQWRIASCTMSSISAAENLDARNLLQVLGWLAGIFQSNSERAGTPLGSVLAAALNG